MRWLPALFVILLLLPVSSYTQVKPALPRDYFEKYSYTLPDTFNYQNEQALRTEAIKIATALDAYLTAATTQYTIDSTELYDVISLQVVPALLLQKNTLALETIQRCRALQPSPAYRVPFALIHEAYGRACLRHADDQSAAFATIFQEEFKGVINGIDTSFRGDIVNAQKGSYTTVSIQVNHTELNNITRQAIQLSQGKLPFSSAYSLLEYYFRYDIRQHYQPQLEALLYQLSPARVEEASVMIPMRDNIRLSAFVYRNAVSTEKVPAVVSLSPYPSGTEATRGNVFATNGYAYVYVDSRGRRKSEGTFFPYEDDARDYYDIIDWVSKQPWCNGQVVTSGGSYLGFAQWQAIRKQYRHPALKAINPMVAVGFGIDFPRLANQFYSYILQWAVYVSGKDLNQARFNDYQFWNKVNYTMYKNRLPFAKLDSIAGLPNPFFQKWVSHPDLDKYWTSILPNKEDYATLDLPILTITGYYDADQLGAFYYYNQHHRYASAKAQSQHYLLIGPYDHGGSQWQPGPVQQGIDIEREAQIPIYKYVIWWYDWILKGKPRPAFLQDKVNYFVTGTGQWKSTSSLQKLTKDTLSLYLSPQLVPNPKRKTVYLLDKQKPVKAQDLTYTHDIAQVIDSAFLFARPIPFDDSLYLSSPYNMVFESKPLEKDIILTGKLTAQLYLSLNVPDADFQFTAYEVDPAGKNHTLSTAQLRSRYRKSGDKPVLMKPGEVALHNFEDVFLYIRQVKKGNKLRFVFESVNSPALEKNYGFGGVVSQETATGPRLIKATIHSSAKYPSRIVLPYAEE
ncbi:CocE/NonD family hydrolase [Paraflavitalea soli]|uniref:CocE/NonD family hydrolase n=1 Tax=Paraflavitalea soli TaxID=2315862 RepID=A0A3B7MIW9_9BACT|nr:CocE/NonD family hydrolase [Paraflavitalea soli]AXY73243.1 CocE/NonD family hydrolase [Paraflavitalea soli]